MAMGRGEERVRGMERVTRKLTLPFVKHGQREFAVWLRKLYRGSVRPRGVGGGARREEVQREGIDVCLRLIHAEV